MSIEILNWLGLPWEANEAGVKRTGLEDVNQLEL
jgi:hypothetical protein